MITQKVIKTELDYNNALALINELMNAAPDTTEFDELELLSTLVEFYEDKIYPVNMPDPIIAIKFRMEQQGLKQQDLVPFLGNRSKVSEVLNGKRKLSLSMMRALNKELGIPADVLLKESNASFPTDDLQLEWDRFPTKEMLKKR